MVEVFVSRLGLDSTTSSYVVVLQEKQGARLLPIWIGKPEAESIVLHMHNVKRVRPLTHDLIKSLVVLLGAQLRRAYITRVEDRTYFADSRELRHGDRASCRIGLVGRCRSRAHRRGGTIHRPLSSLWRRRCRLLCRRHVSRRRVLLGAAAGCAHCRRRE